MHWYVIFHSLCAAVVLGSILERQKHIWWTEKDYRVLEVLAMIVVAMIAAPISIIAFIVSLFQE